MSTRVNIDNLESIIDGYGLEDSQKIGMLLSLTRVLLMDASDVQVSIAMRSLRASAAMMGRPDADVA